VNPVGRPSNKQEKKKKKRSLRLEGKKNSNSFSPRGAEGGEGERLPREIKKSLNSCEYEADEEGRGRSFPRGGVEKRKKKGRRDAPRKEGAFDPCGNKG